MKLYLESVAKPKASPLASARIESAIRRNARANKSLQKLLFHNIVGNNKEKAANTSWLLRPGSFLKIRMSAIKYRTLARITVSAGVYCPAPTAQCIAPVSGALKNSK